MKGRGRLTTQQAASKGHRFVQQFQCHCGDAKRHAAHVKNAWIMQGNRQGKMAIHASTLHVALKEEESKDRPHESF
jgi:hypothetical protein